MRYVAFIVLGLVVMAYRGQMTEPPQLCEVQTCAEQASNILFQSDDGGKTWHDVSQGLPEKTQVNAILAVDEEIYLGTNNGILYHSLKPGMGMWEKQQIHQAFPDAGGEFSEKPITGIYAGRSGPYVGVLNNGFFRQMTGTDFWQPINDGAEIDYVYDVFEYPDGTLLFTAGNGIYKSTDDGKNWKHVYKKWWASNITVSGNDMIATSYDGLLRSSDRGETWELALADQGAAYQTRNVEGGIAALRVAAPWKATESMAPLSITTDGGKTWKGVDGGLSTMGTYDVAQVGKYLFCSTSDGIMRSADGGKSWELVCPLIDPDLNTFFKLNVSGKTVYAVKMRGGC